MTKGASTLNSFNKHSKCVKYFKVATYVRSKIKLYCSYLKTEKSKKVFLKKCEREKERMVCKLAEKIIFENKLFFYKRKEL